jgi:hypothetical protein
MNFHVAVSNPDAQKNAVTTVAGKSPHLLFVLKVGVQIAWSKVNPFRVI